MASDETIINRIRERVNENDWWTSKADPDGKSQVIRLPPATPLPKIRINLKTRVRTVRCTTKRFAPQEFSGFLGNGRRAVHKSHHLAGGEGSCLVLEMWAGGHLQAQGLV